MRVVGACGDLLFPLSGLGYCLWLCGLLRQPSRGTWAAWVVGSEVAPMTCAAVLRSSLG